ncbi:MAG: polyprenyl synthetase family protein [Bacteroidales bacterium]|nr:polyprenyl synthetase family protein [Bacteroidales bacterium]
MGDEIKGFLGEDWLRYQNELRAILASDIELLDSINQYILSNTGKQLRPLLCLLASRACGGSCLKAVPCAVAMELLHTATLIHDDVVDEADTRRGKATISTLYPSNDAVLLGDYWLAKATEVLVDNEDNRVLKAFSHCLAELVRGEIIQLEKSQSMDTDYDCYMSIISKKTAVLFRTAVFCGAYCSGADESTLSAFDDYALHLGLAFQMRDDILDFSPESVTGKPSGQDIREKKITLPLLEAFKSSTKEEISEILQMVRDGKVEEVSAFVIRKGGIEAAQRVLCDESEKAVKALGTIADSKAKDYLGRLALKLSERAV